MLETSTLDCLRNIGGELNSIGEELEQLGAQLCADGVIAARHMHLLQAIDLIGQKQRSMARILLSEDMIGAVRDCEISELMERLTSKDAQTSVRRHSSHKVC